MNNDVSAAFKGWLEKIILTRYPVGGYQNGRWNNSGSKPVKIFGVIQNASPDDLVVLPEGLRTSESIKVHSISDMVALSEADEMIGDTFKYKEKTWQIYNVARRYIGNYNKAIAIRIPNESGC